MELQSADAGQTLRIGRALANCLEAGDVVGLVGPLGAGKTHLVKGIAAGLGVSDDRVVNSPTFVLVNEYQGRLPIYHVDVYRLGSTRELEALGFDEICASGGVVLVEWADRVASALQADALWVDLFVTGPTQRRLVLRTDSFSMARRLDEAGLDFAAA